MTRKEDMLPIQDFCRICKVELSFVDSLYESGLVELTRTEETVWISVDQLPELEKLVRLHYDMEINLQGLEAVHHLLEKISEMQEELIRLRKKLSLYEG